MLIEKNKKLVCVDYNSMIYMSVFSAYLMDKYSQLQLKNSPIEQIDEITRDSFKIIIQKIFNMIERNSDYKVDILFAKDGKKLWRRNRLFSEYKAQRAKIRHESGIDFGLVFKVFNNVWDEIKEILPYRFINVEIAEVDDIIAIVIKNENTLWNKIEIYSADSDFIQLLKYKNVELYNTRKMEYTKSEDPKYELFYKFLHGDKSDNIPNIYSESLSLKQPRIYEKKIKEWYNNKELFKEYIKSQNEIIKKQYIRNVNLIDLSRIPSDIEEVIKKELQSNRTEFDFSKYIKMSNKYGINIMIEKVRLLDGN